MKRLMLFASDPAIAVDLRNALAEVYEVKVFDSYANILTKISGYKPDLLVMDFYLSDGNSAAVSHQIKSNPETKAIPIISISENPDMAKQCIKSGCDQFVPKPVDVDLLKDNIETCLERRKPEPQF